MAHAKRGDVQKSYDRTTLDDDRRRVMQECADCVDSSMRAEGFEKPYRPRNKDGWKTKSSRLLSAIQLDIRPRLLQVAQWPVAVFRVGGLRDYASMSFVVDHLLKRDFIFPHFRNDLAQRAICFPLTGFLQLPLERCAPCE